MDLFGSIKKSYKLKKISKKLDAKSFVRKFMSKGGNAFFDDRPFIKQDKPLNDLYDLIENDEILRSIKNKYNCSRDELKDLFNKLNEAGANQWVGRHLVIVSAFVFGQTLDYLLRHKDVDDLSNVVYRLVIYFEKGEVGFIRE